MFELRRVAYTYNSALEGHMPYFLDCLVQRDAEVLVDVHKQFESKEEFFTAVEEVVPLLEDKI